MMVDLARIMVEIASQTATLRVSCPDRRSIVAFS